MPPLVFNSDASHNVTEGQVYSAVLHAMTCSSTRPRHSGCELFECSESPDSFSAPFDDMAALLPTTFQRFEKVLATLQENWRSERRHIAADPESINPTVLASFPAALQAFRDVITQAVRYFCCLALIIITV